MIFKYNLNIEINKKNMKEREGSVKNISNRTKKNYTIVWQLKKKPFFKLEGWEIYIISI